MIRFIGYGVIAEKPRVGKLGPIFRAPCRKTTRWIEKWMAPFLMASTISITIQSLGKIVQRAPAVGAKMWCLSLFFSVCHAPSPEHSAFDGCIVRTSIALPFVARFRLGFQRCFYNGLLFQKHYLVRIFLARWRHNFREIAAKNCEKSKNRRKSLCAPLRIDSWRNRKEFYCSSLGPRLWMCTYINLCQISYK